MEPNNGNDITVSQQMISSCTGAILTSIFVTPLDVVKIRIQAQQKLLEKNKCFLYCNGLMDHICYCNGNGAKLNSDGNVINLRNMKWFKRPAHFNGTLDGIFKIAKTEGITSLWSGLPPTLVMAVPATVVYFTFYDKFKSVLNSQFATSTNQPIWIPMLAGGCGRVFAASLISPLEMIRTKMQSKKLSYFQMRTALNQMVQQEGWLSLYKGLWPTILRDVPFSCIYWGFYEGLKKKFKQETKPTFVFSFMSGAFAGSLAATVTLPFDVVKTHRQIEVGEKLVDSSASQHKVKEIMKDIYAKHGLRGLFAGLAPRLYKVTPACAIMISVYEKSKEFFRNRNQFNNLKST